MALEKVLVEKQGNICIVKINNPKALNALNSQVLTEIGIAFEDIERDDAIDVAILTGEGKAFVAGADIAEMQGLSSNEAKRFAKLGADVFRRIELMEKPVIAAVNGFALGGGCELSMACDIRIASTKAKFGQPEVGLGITPGFSGTQRLPRLVGAGRAKELLYTGEIISAEEAYRIGLANKVVEPEALMETALTMAKKIASNAQIAVRHAKTCVNLGVEAGIEIGIVLELDSFGLCFGTADQKEGMAAFLEKRPAVFSKK